MELFSNSSKNTVDEIILPTRICAPMVRYSKLAFRMLVRLYETDIAYTPMIMADSFSSSSAARDNEFTTNIGDQPLIVQFAANNVHDFVRYASANFLFLNSSELLYHYITFSITKDL